MYWRYQFSVEICAYTQNSKGIASLSKIYIYITSTHKWSEVLLWWHSPFSVKPCACILKLKSWVGKGGWKANRKLELSQEQHHTNIWKSSSQLTSSPCFISSNYYEYMLPWNKLHSITQKCFYTCTVFTMFKHVLLLLPIQRKRPMEDFVLVILKLCE